MAHALARRADVTLLDTSAKVHHLMSKRFSESRAAFGFFSKAASTSRLGYIAHYRIGVGYRITMILRRK